MATITNNNHNNLSNNNNNHINNNTSNDNNFNNNDDEEEDESIEHIFYLADSTFTDNLPIESIKDLPFAYKYGFGVAILCLWIGLFLYFVVSSYQTGLNNSFVSIESDKYCLDVTKAVNLQILASGKDGSWEGNVGFNYSTAMYQFNFVDLEMTNEEFASAMNGMKNKFIFWNGITSNQNLGINLVFASTIVESFLSTQGTESVQIVASVGNPSFIFNRDSLYFAFADGNRFCMAYNQLDFNVYTATFTATYSYNAYSKANCDSIVSLPNFGFYNSQLETENNANINIIMDMRSLIVAISVNLGITIAADLIEVPMSQQFAPSGAISFEYNNVIYLLKSYYDEKFPGMTPIYCVVNRGALYFCLVRVRNILALPIINHFGPNATYPHYCNCSSYVGHSPGCSAFYLMPGFIVSGEQDTLDGLLTLFGLALRYATQYKVSPMLKLNEDAYLAQYSIITNSTQKPWAKGAFEFCGFNCTILTILAEDNYNQAINDYYYIMANGSCTSIFDVENWDLLAANPPVSLIESYYECHLDPVTSLFDALGISSGNTGLVMSMIGMFVMPLIFYFIQKTTKAEIKVADEYSLDERKLVMDELVTQLLRVRDGKGRLESKSVLRAIVQEMITCAEGDSTNGSAKRKSIRRKSAILRNSRRQSITQDILSQSVRPGGDDGVEPQANPMVQVVGEVEMKSL